MNSIKCPQCGLVNFSTATECKRCHMSMGSQEEGFHDQPGDTGYQSYWPQMPEPEKQRVFSGGVVLLTGILVVATAVLLLQQVMHVFDPQAARGIGGLFGLVGILLLALTHIWLLIRIFEQSVGWGLASVFLPVAGYIAVGKFWEKTKRSFVGQIVCVGIVFVGIGIGL